MPIKTFDQIILRATYHRAIPSYEGCIVWEIRLFIQLRMTTIASIVVRGIDAVSRQVCYPSAEKLLMFADAKFS
ncbi:MAG: hypothetical protein LBH91_07785 [Prevotellaceae bacterium]|nr:hypothetical protein [Prevotellaceae bacterium]